GFSGDAGAGESCVACEAGTFKSFEGPGACLSCPGDGVSAEEGRSCACGAGHFFEDNLLRLSCSGSSSSCTSCTPSVGMSEGAINVIQEDMFISRFPSCSWIISGADPRLTLSFEAVDGFGSHAVVFGVDECADAECGSGYHSLARYQVNYDGDMHLEAEPGRQFQSTTGHLRLSLSPGYMYLDGLDMNATWSTGASKAPGCSPCKAGTYKDTADGACTACPCHAVSPEGSTSLSACTCPEGFTGDAGSGGSCVPCAAGMYKDVGGSAACSWCGHPPATSPCPNPLILNLTS
ncbi:hypothetical protein T484DRAFT_1766745, partial [Baffinella frigidus]